MRNLNLKRIQCDEIWSFCYAKQKNVPEDKQSEMVTCGRGLRDAGYAAAFINDLAGRLANRVQLTTDGHKCYLEAVENAFGGQIDYAMLIKLYGAENPGEARYSPAHCSGTEVKRINGKPEELHISTSYVERHNLTMRMSMRRFTRLTNTTTSLALISPWRILIRELQLWQ